MSSSLPVFYLRRLRKQAGLRQAELAQLLGIHVNQVSRYERREAKPPIEIVFSCCIIFDCSMQTLYPSLYRDILMHTKQNAEHLDQQPDASKYKTISYKRSIFLAALVTRINALEQHEST